MATYKVIQDIEAEDKLLGPLSLRQFIYAIIVVVCGFFAFRLFLVNPILAFPFVPPMILFGFLASPFSKDQPSEVWLLAKIRFFLVPRKRIWDQSGIKELVTITAPKKIEKVLTKDMSQTEVRSRLEALANTIDSRGWAVKNVNVNMFAQPAYALNQADSDRLIDTASLPQDVPAYDVQAFTDILDPASNPQAQALDQMINSSAAAHKQQVMQTMQAPAPQPQTSPTQPPADYWFMNQGPQAQIPADQAVFNKPQTVQPGAATAMPAPTPEPVPSVSLADEQALLEKIHAEQQKPALQNSHLKTLQPLGTTPTQPAVAQAPEPTPQAKQELMSLAGNDDLNIETIARQANKTVQHQKPNDDEVVINLH